jgi:hypothetical protein
VRTSACLVAPLWLCVAGGQTGRENVFTIVFLPRSGLTFDKSIDFFYCLAALLSIQSNLSYTLEYYGSEQIFAVYRSRECPSLRKSAAGFEELFREYYCFYSDGQDR